MPAFTSIALGVSAAAMAGGAAASAANQPEAPDYSKATREGISAELSTLPLRKMIDAAAKAGTKVTYKDPLTGKERTADFTGFGDADQSARMLQEAIKSSDTIAQKQIDLQNKYGETFIQQRLKELEMTDPAGFALRKKMGEKVSADLDAGYGLTDDLRNQVVQSERAAQAARGNIMGASSGAAEAMATGDAAFRMYQQRLANASSFLSGTTPVAQFGQISGAQQGAVGMQMQPVQQGIGVNQNAGAQGAQFALSNYQNQQSQWLNSPWTNLFGQVQGMGMSGVGQGANSLFGKAFGG